MRLPAPAKSHPVRTEQIILFRVSGHLFAVSSASVQEVRSVDTLAGAAKEIAQAGVSKVRHTVQRGENTLYVVNGAMHFGLPPFAPALVFVLRRTRTALLVDGIEKMTTMTRLQALPQAFCHEERDWYRGVTAIDQTVVPVVKPEGFLTPDELFLLDTSLQPPETETQIAGDFTDEATTESASQNAQFALGAARVGSKGADSVQPVADDPESHDAAPALFEESSRSRELGDSANASSIAGAPPLVSDGGSFRSPDTNDSASPGAIPFGSKGVLFAQLDSDDSASYPQ